MANTIHCRSLASILVALAFLLACRPAPPTPIPDGAPRLVLFVVVDQLRADYLVRFRPLFHYGLDRLLRESVVFSDAHHQHDTTSTAPGHATLSTGAFPSSHGIVGNEWFDRKLGEDTYVLDDTEDGASPRRLLRPTLGDRMKEAWPTSKVFGIGGKDRSAALTAGLEADAAYWYDTRTGKFTTSSYYRHGPATGKGTWWDEFFARHPVDHLFATTWTPLSSAEETAPYGVEVLERRPVDRQFPYALGSLSAYPDRAFYSAIYGTPFIDEYVVELAKALITGEKLGADEVPDFLGVALSALDAVGHSYGPDAPETLDTLLRVDRVLGDLLDFVDRTIGLEHVIVSLSADHGVGDVPEVRLAHGLDGGRIDSAGVACVQRTGAEVGQRFGLEGHDWMPEFLYLDRGEIEAAGAAFDDVRRALATGLEACPRVAKVFLPEDIDSALDPLLAELYHNGYHPERSADLLILLEPNTLLGGTIASHGQAQPYDTHVPWLLRLPQVESVTVSERVRTVDVAPTIATFLGVAMTGADGHDVAALWSSTTPSGGDPPAPVTADSGGSGGSQ